MGIFLIIGVQRLLARCDHSKNNRIVITINFLEGRIQGGLLQKFSVLYYVQALCPVPFPIEPDTPALARMFLSPAAPPSIATAVAGLLALTVLVLWLASIAIRKLQIDYGTD